MPYTRRASIGCRSHADKLGASARDLFARIGRHLFRSRDLNAPIDGVRPEPGLRNITLLETTARSRNRSFEMNVMLNHRPRRFTANIGYTLGRGAERNGRGAVAAAEQLRSCRTNGGRRARISAIGCRRR